MRDFKKKHHRRTEWLALLRGAAWLLALCAVAFLAARGAWGMYQKFAEASAAQAQADAQLSDLNNRYIAVKSQVDALATSRGMEAVVRERYGVVKPGEGEIDIVQQSTSTPSTPQQQGFWQKLWQLLFVW